MNSKDVKVKSAEEIIDEETGSVVTLPQILSHLKSFSLREPFLFLVGSLPRRGSTDGDIDILVRGGSGEIEESMKVPLESQIKELFPENLKRRIHVLWNENDGPFSSYIPIGKLKFEVPDNISVLDIVQMSLQSGDTTDTWVYQCEKPEDFEEFEVSSDSKMSVGDKILFCKGREVFASSSVADLKASGGNLIVSRTAVADISPFILDDSVDEIRRFSLMRIERVLGSVQSDASISRQEDHIIPGRFFLPLGSPAKSISANKSGEHFNVGDVGLYAKEQYGVQFDLFVEKKYDGVYATFHYDGEDSSRAFVFFSDDGQDITKALQSEGDDLIKIFRGKSVVASVVVESWDGEEHLPREVTTERLLSESNVGAVLTKEEIEGKKKKKPKIVVNCLTVLYYDGCDLHRSSESDRRKLISAFGWPQSSESHLILASSYQCMNADELNRAVSICTNSIGSDGATIKRSDMIYPLDGFSSEFFELRNYEEATVVVWRKNRTKTDGVFNYDFALSFTEKPDEKCIVCISGNEYTQIGRSYNIAVDIPVGGVVTIRYRQVNWYESQSRMLIYEPTFVRYLPAARIPDSVEDVKESASALGFLEIKNARRNLDIVVNLDEKTRTRLQISKEFQTAIPVERMPREGLGSESCVLFRDENGGLHYSRFGGVVDGKAELLVTQPISVRGGYCGGFDSFRYLSEGAVVKRIGCKIDREVFQSTVFNIAPVSGGTIFDPMCGDGGFLYEAAKHGYTVVGNDVSPLAFHFTRSRFLSKDERLSADEFKAVMDGVTPKGGLWTSGDIWKETKEKVSLEVTRFIDGLISSYQNDKFVMGAIARFLSVLVGPDGVVRDNFGGLSLQQTKKMLTGIALAINQQEVLTGKVTRKEVFSTPLPDADCVFFNSVQNTNRYRDVSSLIDQEIWMHDKSSVESIGEFVEKLERQYENLILIESSKSVLNLSSKLSDLGRRPKRKSVFFCSDYQVEKLEAEVVYCSLSAEEINRQSSNYMVVPDEDGTYHYGIQAHFKGQSVHWDFGATGILRDKIIGWTLNVQNEESIETPVLTMADGRRELSELDWKIDPKTGEWGKRKRGSKMINAEIGVKTKLSKPDSLLRFQGVIEAGGPGATQNFPGVYINLDYGTIEYGAQKSMSHEYFFTGGKVFDGRYIFRLLRTVDRETEVRKVLREIDGGEVVSVSGEEFESRDKEKADQNGVKTGWVLIRPKDQTPYVLSSRAQRLDWMPPDGISALPKRIRSEIPKDLTYWEKGITLLERKSRREEVSGWYSKGHPGISRTAEEPFERFLLTHQWFKGAKKTDEYQPKDIWSLYLIGKQVRVFELDRSLTESSEIVAIESQDRTAEDIEQIGFIAPGTKLNRDSDTPSFIDRVDQGLVTVYLNKPKIIKLRLGGSLIKSFLYMSEADGSWKVEKNG